MNTIIKEINECIFNTFHDKFNKITKFGNSGFIVTDKNSIIYRLYDIYDKPIKHEININKLRYNDNAKQIFNILIFLYYIKTTSNGIKIKYEEDENIESFKDIIYIIDNLISNMGKKKLYEIMVNVLLQNFIDNVIIIFENKNKLIYYNDINLLITAMKKFKFEYTDINIIDKSIILEKSINLDFRKKMLPQSFIDKTIFWCDYIINNVQKTKCVHYKTENYKKKYDDEDKLLIKTDDAKNYTINLYMYNGHIVYHNSKLPMNDPTSANIIKTNINSYDSFRKKMNKYSHFSMVIDNKLYDPNGMLTFYIKDILHVDSIKPFAFLENDKYATNMLIFIIGKLLYKCQTNDIINFMMLFSYPTVFNNLAIYRFVNLHITDKNIKGGNINNDDEFYQNIKKYIK